MLITIDYFGDLDGRIVTSGKRHYEVSDSANRGTPHSFSPGSRSDAGIKKSRNSSPFP